MKKTERNKLHKLLRELVLIRDKRCLRCGKESILHTSHIYPRGKYPRMQFLPENVKALCTGCHLYWWHKHPIEAREWAIKALGRPRLNKLKKIANTIKYGSYDYKEIKQELETKIKEIKNG